MGIVLESQYNGCRAYSLCFALLFACFFLYIRMMLVSCLWVFFLFCCCCSSFIASSLTLSSDSLRSLTLLLPVDWDGSRTAGSVLQSSVSGFNIPIQSPLAVFSHPAHAGTLSFTLLLPLSFFTTFRFISHLVLGYVSYMPLSLIPLLYFCSTIAPP